MIPEEILIQYGALGAFTIYLIIERRTQGAIINRIIDRNTEAFYRISEVIKKCPTIGKK